jgi:hypothetical protein
MRKDPACRKSCHSIGDGLAGRSRAGVHKSVNTADRSGIDGQTFNVSAAYVVSDRPGYLSRARLSVMSRTSKSS